MIQQRTLKSLTRAVGVGVHSGHKVELTLRPAPPDTGIVFRRTDLPVPVEIPVNAAAVSDTRMASTISPGGDPGAPKVQTIEHLMSACAGLGLDNLVVDITAEEVPILDGSAASFVFLLQSAGIELQNAPKRFLRVKKTVEVREGEGAALKWARLEPHHGYRLAFDKHADKKKDPSNHRNGWVRKNCKTEAQKLIDEAKKKREQAKKKEEERKKKQDTKKKEDSKEKRRT